MSDVIAFKDSNNNYLLTTVNLEKYFCFSHDSDDYIGILFPLGTNFNIIIINNKNRHISKYSNEVTYNRFLILKI